MCHQALNGKCSQLWFTWQLIFSPAQKDLLSFCTENIFSYSSSGKAWYLKDTAKQTRNMHMLTQSSNKTHRSSSKYKVLDMLALRTSYKSNTCTIKNYIFFLLSHSKAHSYWPHVKICNAWAVMQDHTQLRAPELLCWGELFRVQTSSQLPGVGNSCKICITCQSLRDLVTFHRTIYFTRPVTEKNLNRTMKR